MRYVAKHGLSDIGQARTIVNKAYETYRGRLSNYSPELTWLHENQARVSFTVMRKTIDAQFFINEQEIRIEGSIPLMFRPFQSKIEQVIGAEIEKWIRKAKAGE